MMFLFVIFKDKFFNNNKLFNFVDLAGHEKYLKTTIKGINRCFIDYACVLVGSNKEVIMWW